MSPDLRQNKNTQNSKTPNGWRAIARLLAAPFGVVFHIFIFCRRHFEFKYVLVHTYISSHNPYHPDRPLCECNVNCFNFLLWLFFVSAAVVVVVFKYLFNLSVMNLSNAKENRALPNWIELNWNESNLFNNFNYHTFGVNLLDLFGCIAENK